MDKSKWPKSWKDQYNNVIRRRKELLKPRQKRDDYLDRSSFPKIWERECDEESVFSFIGHNFPLEDVLATLLKKFIGPDKKENIRLSSRYLYNTQNIFPGYYSDRERIIVMLNNFKKVDDFSELYKWLDFQSKEKGQAYTNLLLGILYLNQFICNLKDDYQLHCAIHQLEKVKPTIKNENAALALNAVLAFSYYMSNEFDKSISYLEPRKEGFERDFKELIKKVA